MQFFKSPKTARCASFLTLPFSQHERDFVRESSLKSHLKKLDYYLHRKQNLLLDHEAEKPVDDARYITSLESPSPGKPPTIDADSVKAEPSPDLDQVPTRQQILDSAVPESPALRSNLDSESCSLSSYHSEFAQSHSQADELPPGWRCRQSRKWGRPFYYHSASGRSQWHPPTADAEQSSTMC